jgi:hypothetical protein
MLLVNSSFVFALRFWYEVKRGFVSPFAFYKITAALNIGEKNV